VYKQQETKYVTSLKLEA